MKKSNYTAADLARLSGLTRPYIYHLMTTYIIRPSSPPGVRARFDEDALRVARAFVRLQRRGVGPKSLAKLLAEAVRGFVVRWVTESVQPLRDELDRFREGILRMLMEGVLETHRDGIKEGAWDAAFYGKLREGELREKVRQYMGLQRQVAEIWFDLSSIPADDPVWEPLGPFFRDRRERDEFLDLLRRTGALPLIVGKKPGEPLYRGEPLREGG